MAGTSFSSKVATGLYADLTDENGLIILGHSTGAVTGGANLFAKGAIVIRTDTGALYQNTGTSASPTWTANLAGGTGAAGAQGAQGAQGAGPQGTQGPQGAQGAQGA